MAPTESPNPFRFYLPAISDSSSFFSFCPLFLRMASDHIRSFLPPTHSAPGRTSSPFHSNPIGSFRVLRDKVKTGHLQAAPEALPVSAPCCAATKVRPASCPLGVSTGITAPFPTLRGRPSSVSHTKPSMALLQAFHQTTLSSSTYLSLVFRICSS